MSQAAPLPTIIKGFNIVALHHATDQVCQEILAASGREHVNRIAERVGQFQN